jgi:hypothetical protein
MGSKTRAGFGAEEKGFRWGIFILLMVLYALLLNPRCWPKEQDSGFRIQDSGPAIHNSPITNHQSLFTIFSHQANPYVPSTLTVIGLEERPRWIGALQAPPQAAGPEHADQVLLKVYDAVNGALKANATLSGGSTNPTPHNADQVFLAIYDPTTGTIRINIVAGSITDPQLASAYSGVGACGANTWARTLNKNAAPTCTQPAFSNISGTVAASQLPAPSASSLGGVESLAQTSHQWINSISTSGAPASSQPASSDLSDASSLLLTTNNMRHQYVAGTGGVTANKLVKLATDGTVVAVTGNEMMLGIAETTAVQGANVVVDKFGPSTCVAEGSITAGDYVMVGSTDPTACKDTGQTLLTNISLSVRLPGKAIASASNGQTFAISSWPRFGSQITATDLPNPTASTLGGIESLAAVNHKWINTISTSGVPSATQPGVADLSDTPSQGQVLAGPSAYGATTATGAFRALAPQDMPSGVLSCAVLDNAICTSSVDASGNPNYLAAGSGATIDVNGNSIPLTYFVGGVYQQINSQLAITATTPASDTAYFIIVKQDTSNANPVNSDLVATNIVPAYQYTAPTCSASATATNPHFWYDLSSNTAKWCTTNGGSFSAQASLVLGVAVVSSSPAVVAVLSEPYRLNPYKRYEVFGNGSEGALTVTGTSTVNNMHQYNFVLVDGGTLTHSAGATMGLFITSQNPVLLISSGAISVNAKGASGGTGGTGTGPAANGGYEPGATGGGGGGAGSLYTGGAGGSIVGLTVQAGGIGGGAGGGVGANGTGGSSTVTAIGLLTYNNYVMGFSGGGGAGAGDGSSNGGSGGRSGGVVVIRAPSILIASGASISAVGGNGTAPAGGNAGGGGGAGGGTAIAAAGFITDGAGGSPTPTATGGNYGAGSGTGGHGGAGGAGSGLALKMW